MSNWIQGDMKVRSVRDLPKDDIQQDSLRRLANYWRSLANGMASTGDPEGLAAANVAFELADQLTAILNERVA